MTGTSIQRSDVRDAWTLTQTELRTFVRHLRGDLRKGLSVVFMVLMFGVAFPLLFITSAMGFGNALATGTVSLGPAGAAFGAVIGLAGYIGVAGGFNQPRVGQIGPLVRTSIPPMAVSLGRFWNRLLQALGLVVPAGLVLLAGVAVGAGSLLPAVLVGIAAVPLFAVALIGGRIVGDLARYANERLQVSLWVKAAIGAVLMAVIFVGTQVLMSAQYENAEEFSSVISGPLIPGTPLQSYAGVVFAPLGSTPTALGLVVTGLVLASIPVSLLAMIRLETLLLVRDVGSDAEALTVEGSHGVPDVFEVTPSARVAWRYLLRTRRDPRMLAHLSVLLFGALGMAGSAIQDPGFLLTIGPAAAVVSGAATAGAAYGLNPLGDDRDQLPLLLTSTRSVGVLLRGRMIAGIVLGLVVAIGVGTPLSIVEHSPGYVLGQSLLAVFLAVVGAGIAVGLGAVVPKFEQREYMNVERAHPSQFAMMGFFFGAMIVGGIGFLLLWATVTGKALLAVAFGWLLYVTILGVAAYGGYRYAVRRMDAFTMDDI